MFLQKPKSNLYSVLKNTAAFTAFTFIFTSTAGAAPLLPPAEFSAPVSISVPPITIPNDLAHIEKVSGSFSEGRPAVFYIQDAHSNYEAQKSIKALLRHLHTEEGITLALTEGAGSDLDIDRLRFFPNEELNKDVLDRLAKRGIATGLELYLMEAGNDFRASGIEDGKLYADNLRTFRRVIKARPRTEQFLGRVREEVSRLSNRLLNRELRVFADAYESYRTSRSDLRHYLSILKEAAEHALDVKLDQPITQIEYPQLYRYMLLEQSDHAIDKARLTTERDRLTKKLSGWGVSNNIIIEFENLLSRDHALFSSNGKDARAPRDVLEDLYAEAVEHGFRFSDYPIAHRYAERLLIQSELHPLPLAKEIDRLSYAVRDALVGDRQTEEKVLALLDDLHLLDAAISLSLEKDDLIILRADMRRATPSALVERLRLLDEVSAFDELTAMSRKLDGFLSVVNRFYEGAEKRDEVMVKKTLERMKQAHVDKAVIITGGFHADTMSALFEKENASYVILTPKISEIDLERKKYYRVMMQEANVKTSEMMQEIISQAMLGQIQEWALDRPGFLPEEVLAAFDRSVAEGRYPFSDIARVRITPVLGDTQKVITGGVDDAQLILTNAGNRHVFTSRLVTTTTVTTAETSIAATVTGDIEDAGFGSSEQAERSPIRMGTEGKQDAMQPALGVGEDVGAGDFAEIRTKLGDRMRSVSGGSPEQAMLNSVANAVDALQLEQIADAMNRKLEESGEGFGSPVKETLTDKIDGATTRAINLQRIVNAPDQTEAGFGVAQAEAIAPVRHAEDVNVALEIMKASYRTPDANGQLYTDEFMPPIIVGAPDDGRVDSNDAMIPWNTRNDRMRELMAAFLNVDITDGGSFRGFPLVKRLKNLFVVMMTKYHDAFGKMAPHVINPLRFTRTMLDVMQEKGIRVLRATESEKKPHVTHFLDGQRDIVRANEEVFIVPSPKEVGTYDKKPEMAAEAVTDRVVKSLEDNEHDFIFQNFANTDMVGHTGNFEAAVKAAEVVDTQIGRIRDAVHARSGLMIIFSDHGNAEEMVDEKGRPHTKHTMNPVHFIIYDPTGKINARTVTLRDIAEDVKTSGKLSDIWPTIAELFGWKLDERKPEEYPDGYPEELKGLSGSLFKNFNSDLVIDPKKRPVVVIQTDGWGEGPKTGPRAETNAILQAHTPVMDEFEKNTVIARTRLYTHGQYVGLPPGIQGGSEIGHKNIGLEVIAPTEISSAFQQMQPVEVKPGTVSPGEFFNNKNLLRAMAHVKKFNSKLHLPGLLSDGGVHSHLEHLFALLDMAEGQGVREVVVHAFTDGRDTAPTSAAEEYIPALQKKIAEINARGKTHVRLATIIGRYWAMDRDRRWGRTELAYNVLTRRVAANAELPFIVGAKAMWALDSRGNPTVRAQIHFSDGFIAEGFVPSGASTGAREALELRDGAAAGQISGGMRELTPVMVSKILGRSMRHEEAIPLLEKALGGKDTRLAIYYANYILLPRLLDEVRKGNVSLTDQRTVDDFIKEMEKKAGGDAERKTYFGANATLAVSVAALRAGAHLMNLKAFEHIADGGRPDEFGPVTIQANVLNGGAHGDNNVDVQETMVNGFFPRISESLRTMVPIFHRLGKNLKRDHLSTSVGDEGGYAASVTGGNVEYPTRLEEAAKAALTDQGEGNAWGKTVGISVDVAASGLAVVADDATEAPVLAVDGLFQYRLEGEVDASGTAKPIVIEDGKILGRADGDGKHLILTSAELVDYYVYLLQKYPIDSIEDPLHEDDFDGYWRLTQFANDPEFIASLPFEIQRENGLDIVGDDLPVTQLRILKAAVEGGEITFGGKTLKFRPHTFNAILIKINQVGTITDALDTIRWALAHGISVKISHRSGETEDAIIADIAKAVTHTVKFPRNPHPVSGRVPKVWIKTGSFSRSDRNAKFNRLIEIEDYLDGRIRLNRLVDELFAIQERAAVTGVTTREGVQIRQSLAEFVRGLTERKVGAIGPLVVNAIEAHQLNPERPDDLELIAAAIEEAEQDRWSGAAAGFGRVRKPSRRLNIYAQDLAIDPTRTGDLSLDAIRKSGARAVMIGDSDTRRETLALESQLARQTARARGRYAARQSEAVGYASEDRLMADKLHAALDARVIEKGEEKDEAYFKNIVYKVGETVRERREGRTREVVRRQLGSALEDVKPGEFRRISLAYQPREGQTLSIKEIKEMTDFIRSELVALFDDEDLAGKVNILFEGRLTPENVPAVLLLENVDGLIVDDAAKNPKELMAITEAALEASNTKQNGRTMQIIGNHRARTLTEDQDYIEFLRLNHKRFESIDRGLAADHASLDAYTWIFDRPAPQDERVTSGELAEYIGNWAFDITYKDLSAESIRRMKHFFANANGNALRAFNYALVRAERAKAFDEVPEAGAPAATIFGTKHKSTLRGAAGAKGTAVRDKDDDNTFLGEEPAHPDDVHAVLEAIAEAEGNSGQDLILASIVAYEVQVRFAAGLKLRDTGIDHVAFVALGVAAGAAKLRALRGKMTRAQTIEAIRLAASHAYVTLRGARQDDLNSVKSKSASDAAKVGLEAVTDAQRGLTGSENIFEKKYGFNDQLLRGLDMRWFLKKFPTRPSDDFAVVKEVFPKDWQAEYHMQSGIRVGIDVHKELRRASGDKSAVRDGLSEETLSHITKATLRTFEAVLTILRGERDLDNPPPNRASADHDAAFIIAASIVFGWVDERTYTKEILEDSRVLRLRKMLLFEEDEEATDNYYDDELRWNKNTVALELDGTWRDEGKPVTRIEVGYTNASGHVTEGWKYDDEKKMTARDATRAANDFWERGKMGWFIRFAQLVPVIGAERTTDLWNRTMDLDKIGAGKLGAYFQAHALGNKDIANLAVVEPPLGEVDPSLIPEGVQPPRYSPGLRDVVAGPTAIAVSSPDKGLRYRGYNITEFAEQGTSFEEVAFLFLYKQLPNSRELREFRSLLDSYRALDEHVIEFLKSAPDQDVRGSEMDVMATAIAIARHFDQKIPSDQKEDTPEGYRTRAVWLMAQSASILAARQRFLKGMKAALKPRSGLSHAAQLLYQMNGAVPTEEAAGLLNLTLILYAEHGFNNSSYAAVRGITSTESDLLSAVIGGIGSLKGPLHGGANEDAMEMMAQFGHIESPGEARDAARHWAREAIARGVKLKGYGHAYPEYTYGAGDPRAVLLEEKLRAFAKTRPDGAKWMAIYDAIKAEMNEKGKGTLIPGRGIQPNTDYPSALLYYFLGFPIKTYTPLFVVSRIGTGWAAHAIEQRFDKERGQKLIRPKQLYDGPADRPVPTLARRDATAGFGIQISGARLDLYPSVRRFVEEQAAFLGASKVEVIDASDEARLIQEALKAGEIYAVTRGDFAGNYYANSHPKDVARVVERTFITTSDESDKGHFNRWHHTGDILPKVQAKMRGALTGKKMYAVPYWTGNMTGIQLTDNRFVVLNILQLYKVGKDRFGRSALAELNKSEDFTKAIHVTGDLDSLDRSLSETDDRWFINVVDQNMIFSYGSAYGGNAILPKKFHALRQAMYLARKSIREGGPMRLAEHMLTLGIQDLKTKDTRYYAMAAPAASGKTNNAMLLPPEALSARYRTWLVSDDISHMEVVNGKLHAVNAESGVFGVVPGTNDTTNKSVMDGIRAGKGSIFTNVAAQFNEDRTEVVDLYWEGLGDKPYGLAGWYDWKGEPIVSRPSEARRGEDWAHKNSRVTMRIELIPNWIGHAGDLIENEHERPTGWNNPDGVVIDALFVGARLSSREVLLRQLPTPEAGIADFITMVAEGTAAETGALGAMKEDSFAQRPFYSIPVADHAEMWLAVMDELGDEYRPTFNHMNVFRRGSDGRWLFVGFRENLRLFEWEWRRALNKDLGVRTPVGIVPRVHELDLKDYPGDVTDLELTLEVDYGAQAREFARQANWLAGLTKPLPERILAAQRGMRTSNDLALAGRGFGAREDGLPVGAIDEGEANEMAGQGSALIAAMNAANPDARFLTGVKSVREKSRLSERPEGVKSGEIETDYELMYAPIVGALGAYAFLGSDNGSKVVKGIVDGTAQDAYEAVFAVASRLLLHVLSNEGERDGEKVFAAGAWEGSWPLIEAALKAAKLSYDQNTLTWGDLKKVRARFVSGIFDVIEVTNGTVKKSFLGTVSTAFYTARDGAISFPDNAYIYRWVLNREASRGDAANNLRLTKDLYTDTMHNIKNVVIPSAQKSAANVSVGLLLRERNESQIRGLMDSGIYVEETDIKEMYKRLEAEGKGYWWNGNILLIKDGDLMPSTLLDIAAALSVKPLDVLTGLGAPNESALGIFLGRLMGATARALAFPFEALQEGKKDADTRNATWTAKELERWAEHNIVPPGASEEVKAAIAARLADTDNPMRYPVNAHLGDINDPRRQLGYVFTEKELFLTNDAVFYATSVTEKGQTHPSVITMDGVWFNDDTGDVTVDIFRATASNEINVLEVRLGTIFNEVKGRINDNEIALAVHPRMNIETKRAREAALGSDYYELARLYARFRLFGHAEDAFFKAALHSSLAADLSLQNEIEAARYHYKGIKLLLSSEPGFHEKALAEFQKSLETGYHKDRHAGRAGTESIAKAIRKHIHDEGLKKAEKAKRISLIAGNWKTPISSEGEARQLVRDIAKYINDRDKLKKAILAGEAEMLVAPPVIYLQAVRDEIITQFMELYITLGAQNVWEGTVQPVTGETTLAQLKDMGVKYVIVGHSERREHLGETSQIVNTKAKLVEAGGLVPIIAVGETADERRRGEEFNVVSAQVRESTVGVTDYVIAYEPVWAIGKKRLREAKPKEGEEMARFIRGIEVDDHGVEQAAARRILFGGSVKPSNVDALLANKNIDGALVGGASLVGTDFGDLTRSGAGLPQSDPTGFGYSTSDVDTERTGHTGFGRQADLQAPLGTSTFRMPDPLMDLPALQVAPSSLFTPDGQIIVPQYGFGYMANPRMAIGRIGVAASMDKLVREEFHEELVRWFMQLFGEDRNTAEQRVFDELINTTEPGAEYIVRNEMHTAVTAGPAMLAIAPDALAGDDAKLTQMLRTLEPGTQLVPLAEYPHLEKAVGEANRLDSTLRLRVRRDFLRPGIRNRVISAETGIIDARTLHGYLVGLAGSDIAARRIGILFPDEKAFRDETSFKLYGLALKNDPREVARYRGGEALILQETIKALSLIDELGEVRHVLYSSLFDVSGGRPFAVAILKTIMAFRAAEQLTAASA